jgi:hypothetical protein
VLSVVGSANVRRRLAEAATTIARVMGGGGRGQRSAGDRLEDGPDRGRSLVFREVFDGPEVPWGVAVIFTAEGLVVSASHEWVGLIQLALAALLLTSSGWRSATIAGAVESRRVIVAVAVLVLFATGGILATRLGLGGNGDALLLLAAVVTMTGWLGLFPPYFAASLGRAGFSPPQVRLEEPTGGRRTSARQRRRRLRDSQGRSATHRRSR